MDTQLMALLGDRAPEVEAVIQNAPIRWQLDGSAREAVVLLAKTGISSDDMSWGLEAACRTVGVTGWTVEKAAEFVGTAAAIGGLHGGELILIANLARVAAH
jgi:hypothetical protein